jgi:multimeric flavodoxin WrbA
MKILILNASPRKKGWSAQILKEIQNGISTEHPMEWVDISSLTIHPCIGCLQCRSTKECVIPNDDAHRVGAQIEAADVLIIGTPNYWGNMTGQLKNLFDRSVMVMEEFPNPGGFSKPRHRGKKAILVTSSGSPWPFNLLSSQGSGAIHSLKRILHGGGFRIVGIINYGAGKASQLPSKIIKKARKLGRTL